MEQGGCDDMGKTTMLIASDIHGKENIVEAFVDWIYKMGHSFDMIVIAGDIGNPQKPQVFRKILEKISVFKKPIYYVEGNWDVNYQACDKGVNLENSGPIEFDNFILVGHGKRMSPFKEVKYKGKPIILVTHYPPYSIMDRGKRLESSQQSLHSGLPEINYLLDFYQPFVHVFGHSHSFGGIDWKINHILYANVARLDRTAKDGMPIGNYALLTIGNDRNVKIDWYFINGVWKSCSLCGRRFHLPRGWSICRKCANRNNLKFVRIDSKYSNLQLTVYTKEKDAEDERNLFFTKNLNIPIYTIKDYLAFEDFLDILMIRMVIEELKKRYFKVIIVPKDKIIEFYGEHSEETVIPFSEYLFSCDEKTMGKKLCTLMKLFSLSKHIYVIWGFKENEENYVLDSEYVLFNEKISKENVGLIETLYENNFIPLLYRREFTELQKAPRKMFESLRRILGRRKS